MGPRVPKGTRRMKPVMDARIREGWMAALPARPRRWRDIFIVEASGLRTALAVLIPVIVGQLAGRPPLGVMVAAGALQLALVDTQGATPRTLLLGVAGCVAALFAGGIAGDLPLVPAVLLVLLLAFLLRMLPIYGEAAGNLGFIILLTYASAQSVP